MEFESIRPIFSGLAGGLIAVALCHSLSRWVPAVCGRKSAALLLRQNRVAIWLANLFFFCGILAGIALYQLGYLPNADWRGLALGVGSGSILALLVMPVFALLSGHSPKEAYVAYAISQKTPLLLLYGILVSCVTFFGVAVASVSAGT